MNQLEERLQQLAIEAQQHSPKSRGRRLALTRLIQIIQASGRLSRRRYDTPQEVYDEALQETWLYVFKKIDTYEPRGPVINWVNYVFKRRLIDARKRHTKQGREYSLDAPINSSDGGKGMTYLDTVAQPEDTPLPSQLIRQCIEEDADGLFASKHVRGHPKANFRTIALLYLDRKSWQQTAVAVGLKPKQASTVQSFYWRCCKYFSDTFKEYLQE
ncbi:RNA polymerase sigma factor [Moorena producens]|uniref:RNA polymerase sigma factor n=1 Tax=Moorena producens TaxID=1155739 RepID=UPI003C758F6E